MADTPRPPRQERLLIKVIMPKQYTMTRVPGGGTPPKPFRPVDQKYRASLSSQVSAIRAAIIPQIKTAGAAPVRVKLVSQAAAKSHRPENLFSAQSCPIVSGGGLGELFVKATPEGLDRLTSLIEHNTTDRMTKELSCVETIEPVTPSYRRSGLDAAEVLRHSPRGKNGFITRVGLFNFGPDRDQPNLVTDLRAACKRREIALNARGYSPSSYTYEAECRTVEDVEARSRLLDGIDHQHIHRFLSWLQFQAKLLANRRKDPGSACFVRSCLGRRHVLQRENRTCRRGRFCRLRDGQPR